MSDHRYMGSLLNTAVHFPSTLFLYKYYYMSIKLIFKKLIILHKFLLNLFHDVASISILTV